MNSRSLYDEQERAEVEEDQVGEGEDHRLPPLNVVFKKNKNTLKTGNLTSLWCFATPESQVALAAPVQVKWDSPCGGGQSQAPAEGDSVYLN